MGVRISDEILHFVGNRFSLISTRPTRATTSKINPTHVHGPYNMKSSHRLAWLFHTPSESPLRCSITIPGFRHLELPNSAIKGSNWLSGLVPFTEYMLRTQVHLPPPSPTRGSSPCDWTLYPSPARPPGQFPPQSLAPRSLRPQHGTPLRP